MCEPTTIIMGVSALIGAFSAYQQGETQKDFAEYEAAQGQADANAEAGMARVEAERIRKARAFAIGEANAGMAAAGIDVGSGTALNINRDITKRSEEDAYLTLFGGEDRKKRGQAEATLAKARGKSASNAGKLGAGQALLSGAGQSYSAWKTAGSPGFGPGTI